MPKSQVEADIQRIETGLKQLKVQYDQYFAGALEKQPFDLRHQVDRLIRHWTRTPIQSYATRFHLNTLVSRYNSLTELWGRQFQCRDAGKTLDGRPIAGPGTSRPDSDGTLLRTRVRGGEADERVLRQLHEAYLDANRKHPGKTAPLDYTAFRRHVGRQTRTIREKKGCEAVEFKLSFDGQKVRLRARALDNNGAGDQAAASETGT